MVSGSLVRPSGTAIMPPRLVFVTLAMATAALPAMAEPAAGPDPLPFAIGSCHVNGRSVDGLKRWIPQMAEIGLGFQRSVFTHWGAVEPQPGAWDWSTVDAQLAFLAEHGMHSGALLLGSPGWNRQVPPGHLPVNDLAGWSNYVGRTVAHLKGRVKWYEVWNEPPNFTGPDQTPADYARIVAAACRAAKQADPGCMVGLAAKSAHVQYLKEVIEAGARDHFDWISLHPYEILDGIVTNAGHEPVFLHIVPTVRTMLAAVNPARRDVPVLFTELGCDAGRHGPQAQAHAAVKAYAMSLAQGVASVQWFEGRDGDSGPMGLLDRDGKPRPAWHALQRMIALLGRRPEYLGWVQFDGRHPGFVYQGAAGPVMIAWASGGATATLRFAAPVDALDPLTGETTRAAARPLTAAPVFVTGPPPELLESARRNRGRPLPWGGDFRHARTVSITMGADRAENGLHTRAGDALAEAVVAYGGPARAGNLPGGNLFIVDPGFLCYHPAPIEVTAEVRRMEADENAGFKLVYESPAGFKTAGTWVTIPDNKQWHTIRWRIDDPCFVNYWGYNFALVSDGDVYNKYYIRRVTVTRLDR